MPLKTNYIFKFWKWAINLLIPPGSTEANASTSTVHRLPLQIFDFLIFNIRIWANLFNNIILFRKKTQHASLFNMQGDFYLRRPTKINIRSRDR